MNEKFPEAADSDDVMARLRAADPAAHSDLDLDPAWAVLRDRTAAGGVVVDEVAAARARRNRTWLVRVASVAAAALAFGGGGYAVGHAAGGAPHASGTSTLVGKGNPALASAGTGAVPGPIAQGTGSQSASSAGRPSATDSAFGYGGGRTIFHASGLAAIAGSAEGWTYDARAAFSKESAAKIATALGVLGQPTLVNGAWLVGSTDGTGPFVMIQTDGMASVKFYDPSKDPFACGGGVTKGSAVAPAGPASVAPGTTRATSGSLPAPAPNCVPGDVAAAPTGDAAIAKAKSVLASLGVDVGSLTFEVSDGGQDALAYVSAHQLVKDAPTGMSWGISLAAAGVQSLYGWLAPLVSLGSYDVVSEQDAVSRLSDPRFTAGYGGGIVMDAGGMKLASPGTAAGGSGSVAVSPAPAPTVPPLLAPGSAISWPLEEVTIVKAKLALAVYTQTDGAETLLPTYRLSSADGRTWSVIAIADHHLDFSAR
jgi:hypothetical protein